jgi:membrane protein
MLLALFPVLIVINALLESIGGIAEWEFIFDALPDSVESLIYEYLTHTKTLDSSEIVAGGIFLSVFALVKFVNNLKRHLDTINRVKIKRHFALSWIFSFVMALYFIALLYLSLLCIVFGQTVLRVALSGLENPSLFLSVWHRARFAAVIFLLVLFVVLIFRFLPDRRTGFREVLPGVVFTCAAWIVASLVFSVYINNFSKYSLVYGSLGAVVILLLWLYVLSNIILTGACINLVLSSKDSL